MYEVKTKLGKEKAAGSAELTGHGAYKEYREIQEARRRANPQYESAGNSTASNDVEYWLRRLSSDTNAETTAADGEVILEEAAQSQYNSRITEAVDSVDDESLQLTGKVLSR